jgi:hypothetical protein
MRRLLATLAAAGLSLGGCTYEYQNPAEKLDTGEVAGRVVADTGSGLTGLGGVSVRLRNSSGDPLVTQLTRSNGRFVLLGLAPGRHTVLFSKADGGGTVTWAVTRDVDVAWGSDGQPEGVLIGDVRIRYPVTLTGTFTLPASAATYGFTYWAAFAYDEATGTQGTVTTSDFVTFTYSFPGLPVGPHRLRFAVVGQQWDPSFTFIGQASYAFGPVTKDVNVLQEGQTVAMSPVTLAPPDVATGKLRFRVTAPPTLTGSYSYKVIITDSYFGSTFYETGVDETACSTYSDGTRECDLDPAAYDVNVATTPADGTFYDPPVATGIVTSGQTTDLGTLYITDYNVASQASNSCIDNSDCMSGYLCASGTCQFAHAMEPGACFPGDFSSVCSNAMSACFGPPYATTPCSGGAGTCAEAPDLSWTCVPTGQPDCLWNGAQLVPEMTCFMP